MQNKWSCEYIYMKLLCMINLNAKKKMQMMDFSILVKTDSSNHDVDNDVVSIDSPVKRWMV